MYYKELAERVRYFKETEKGVETMCRTIELMRNETAVQASIQTAKSFGVPDEKIVEHLHSTYDYLSEDESVRLVEEFDED